ncbi:phage capsid protein [Anaerocolumna chitinilytica]|uniref:Portal protein n=1 Tax=Anaerocolumna chitinilytica TaxID=1727145 RepID=A0A7M3SAI9_9FIRM|nr:phage capsid protein [Anaerocolumna chitinilytica]BCK01607.1 portal protein [Anaerocolumna chitinilytica]
MFEGITNFVKEVIRRMFPIKNIKQAMNMDVAITPAMVDKIEEWSQMLKGKAEWVDNDAVYSLRLEQGIVREFSNISLNEMTSKVSVEKLDKIYQTAIKDLNENLQSGIALGQMVIKALGEDKVEYVLADSFIPIEFDERGRLTKVVFVEIKRIKDDDYYFRFEYHALDQNGLTITNKAYHGHSKNDLGMEVPLANVPEWAELEPYINYPLMTKPDFGYYRNPIKNEIDGSFNGVSIFDSAKWLIKHADEQYGRLNWEFESGERAVHVDITALQPNTSWSTEQKQSVAKLNKRMYRGLDIEQGQGKQLFDVFSPEFRDQSILNGLEEYKRNIEFSVGLSYGDISNPSVVEKTATEIISAKKRKYNTVSAIQENLKDCLSDLVDALAFYNGMATTGYQFICDFKDSILVDEETERQQDRQDVSMGVMPLWEYRAKWYGEDEAKAKSMIPQQPNVVI